MSKSLSLFAMLAASATTAQTLPEALKPPEKATPIGTFHAVGVQIYGCGEAGPTWVLKAPEAELADGKGTKIHHFAGPRWQAADGSTVLGKLLAKAPAPDATAIPWLLLAGTPSGIGLLSRVRYIQRLATIGGMPPSGSCTVGGEARVPYTATYVFLE